ncbi:polyphosphate kinase [Clostridium sp. CAG:964]|nr:polyphosphate kinase [Clostridium sp. CAG:964]
MNDFYKNRELSWLQFNERVLDEAGNSDVPLAERLTFASIYQTNLDEFFMVRVGTLLDQMHEDENIKDSKTGMKSRDQIASILKRVKQLEKKKAEIYFKLMGELQPCGVNLVDFNKITEKDRKLLENYFDDNIMPFLSPMVVGKQQPFPFLNNKELYAIVLLSSRSGKERTGIVTCSNSVFKRLIAIPSQPGNFILSEELILHFVAKLFNKYTVEEKSIIRITRNADIDTSDIYDEDLDYRQNMEFMIKRRKRLNPVRIELSRDINTHTKKELSQMFNIEQSHIIKVDTPLDLSFVFNLQSYLYDKKDLFYTKRTPRLTRDISMSRSIIEQIEEKDLLLSYPYQSMKPFIKMLQEAAFDDSVVSIKITLYRVANKSEIIEALVDAAENGKDVVVMVELRARFDEEHNIKISRQLEDAGCKVIYGLNKYKVHSKLCLITKKTSEGHSYITQIGTGNYNEKTSKLYTDLSIITANQQIGSEAAMVFNHLLCGETVENTTQLMVAPHCLQNKVVDLIENEIDKARNDIPAYIGIKINSLTDKVIIDKLVEASKAGVKIEMIVRGICCLIPEIPGETENITVISVVGRYLEHSRIYRFGVGDEAKVYISSADFMTRNTIRRVEVATPVLDKSIKNEICRIFDVIMKDDAKGRIQHNDGIYYSRELNNPRLDSQMEFYAEAYGKEKMKV